MRMMTNCTHRYTGKNKGAACRSCTVYDQVSAVRACMEEVRRDSNGGMPIRVRALLNATEHLCKLAVVEPQPVEVDIVIKSNTQVGTTPEQLQALREALDRQSRREPPDDVA